MLASLTLHTRVAKYVTSTSGPAFCLGARVNEMNNYAPGRKRRPTMATSNSHLIIVPLLLAVTPQIASKHLVILTHLHVKRAAWLADR